MTKRSLFLFAVLLLCIAATKSQTVKTVGISGADYTTLKLAFDAINAGTITGNIELQIIDNTTEAAIAVLNASGSGSASYTAISIYPTVTGKTLSGNLASEIIQLNGADNVTLDGRLNRTGTSVDLTINNTNTTGSAINLIEGATSNTIKYTILKSAGTTSTNASVYFGSSTVSGGNSYNTVSYNSFTGSTTRCMTGIGSLGTAAPNDNVSNTVDNNLFYDMLRLPDNTIAVGFASIRIGNNSSMWTITNNRFYETADVPTASSFDGASYRPSFVNINVGATGGSFSVSNNFFGGRAADGTGMLVKSAGGFSSNYVDFDAIYIKNSTAVNLTSSVQGNTCKNITMRNCFGGSFNFINVAGGSVDVGTVAGNIIGSTTQKGAVQLLHGSCMIDFTVNAGDLRGIYVTSSTAGTVNVQNNTIAGLATYKSNQTVSGSVSGIVIDNLFANTGPTVTVYNNTIGAAMDSSFELTADNSASFMRGVYMYASGVIAHIRNNTIQGFFSKTTIDASGDMGIYIVEGTAWIRNNVIKNLVSYANGGTSRDLAGIRLNANGGVSGNTIFNLTNQSSGGNVTGIESYGQNNSDTGLVYNNYIYNLKVNAGTTGVVGITGISSAARLRNNVVILDQDNQAANIGIYSSASYVLHNTVYIRGTQLGFFGGLGNGALTTAFYSTSGGADIRNNIFVNTRVNAASVTGKHFAIGLRTPTTSLISDYNVYYAPSTNGMVGFYASSSSNPFSSSDKPTLADWQAFTLQDCHSYNEDPGFTDPSVTSSVSSYLPTNTGISGYPYIRTSLTNYSVGTDYYGAARGNQTLSPPATGAIEYATTPRPGYTAPYINSLSRISLGDSATITVSGSGMGLVTTVPFTNPAYYFYYVHSRGPGVGNYKVSAVTVLSDTSFKFNVPQISNYDTAYFIFLNVKVCGTATTGYNYAPSTMEALVVNSSLSALPVQWQSFTAKKQTSNLVLLNWATTAEQDAQDFVVQHSTNAQNWRQIGVVAAAGNSIILNKYQFGHKQPTVGDNYYRLLQRDKNGSVSYSTVEIVQFANSNAAFTLASNTISNRQLRVNVAIPTTLRLFTNNGQLLQQFRLTQGSHTLTLNECAKGIYFINALGKTERLIIQ